MDRRSVWMLILSAGLISQIGCRYHCDYCGCRPGPIGWQRGGTDYGNHLNKRYNYWRDHVAQRYCNRCQQAVGANGQSCPCMSQASPGVGVGQGSVVESNPTNSVVGYPTPASPSGVAHP